ncbi:hypothetical protein [Bacillus altitudinis]|uniref:hypothetical protein n=1 Tax=Bacillus altitudinis TaxID=293387 RepID=UPI001F3127D5|nr:hypothetical protein [Bacillus altitudinis]
MGGLAASYLFSVRKPAANTHKASNTINTEENMTRLLYHVTNVKKELVHMR